MSVPIPSHVEQSFMSGMIPCSFREMNASCSSVYSLGSMPLGKARRDVALFLKRARSSASRARRTSSSSIS